MKNTDKKTRFNTKVGEDYDLFRIASPFHDKIQSEVVTLLAQNVLDDKDEIICVEIGYGTGITSKKILDSSTSIKLLGVDNTPLMKIKAEKYLSDTDNQRYKLAVSDAYDYLKTLENDSIDFVVSVWTLHNIEKEHRYLIYKEIYRVLKPNGMFINGDKIADNDSVTHDEDFRWQLKQFEIFEKHGRSDLKKEWTEHYYADEESVRILFEKNYRDDLREIGFTAYHENNRYRMDRVVTVSKPNK